MVNHYLSALIQKSLAELEDAYCIQFDEDGSNVEATALGRIASYYYLSHLTLKMFRERLTATSSVEDLLSILSDCTEYDELPVRHNEDILNGELSKSCPIAVNPYTLDSSHTKTHLLFQVHFTRLALPCADYATDTKSVLDQSIRILQAMIDVAAESGWLATTIRIQQLLQMVIQAIWIDQPSTLILPHLDPCLLELLQSSLSPDVVHLPVLQHQFVQNPTHLSSILRSQLDMDQIQDIQQVLCNLPVIDVSLSLLWKDQSALIGRNANYKDVEWIAVPAGEECLLDVTFTRPVNPGCAPVAASTGARPKNPSAVSNQHRNAAHRNNNNAKSSAYAPRFPKPKDEGWIITLGSVDRNELVAVKRMTLPSAVAPKSCSQQLAFVTPHKKGRCILTFYFLSDSYVGLDQQYPVHIDVVASTRDVQPAAKDYYD